MKKQFLRNFNFSDILKIVMLSFLQSVSMSLFLNVGEHYFMIIVGLIAFISFQLLLILPLNKNHHSTTFRYLFQKTWPILLEIILEFIVMIYFANRLFSMKLSSYDVIELYYYCLACHIIFLSPLYYFIFHISYFSYFLLYLILDLAFRWGSLVSLFGLMIVPFISNLIIQKRAKPSSKFLPSNIAEQIILFIAWYWIAVSGIWILLRGRSLIFQISGLLNIYSLLLLQYFLQQNLTKTSTSSLRNHLIHAEPRASDLDSSSSLKPSALKKCPTCGNQISTQILKEFTEEKPIFCVQCGEKIRYQELFQLSKDKILSDHQEILEKVQQSTLEPNLHENNH